ncbi:hypothetical protein JTE90_006858, partial [Oedothorax gibbosus]
GLPLEILDLAHLFGNKCPLKTDGPHPLNIKKDVEVRTGEEYNYSCGNYYSKGNFPSWVFPKKTCEKVWSGFPKIPTLISVPPVTIHFTQKGFPPKPSAISLDGLFFS